MREKHHYRATALYANKHPEGRGWGWGAALQHRKRRAQTPIPSGEAKRPSIGMNTGKV